MLNRKNQPAAWLAGPAPRAVMAALGLVLAILVMLNLVNGNARAAASLNVEIIAGYNLVVDSNVSSPSTYAPRVATVIGKFCNPGDTALTDVYGYIGNGTTPGTYPARNSLTDAEFQSGQKWNYLYNTGLYRYRHVGPVADASRYIGTIPAGQCVYQYWTIEYPACENVGGAWQEPPCTGDPVWGTSIKPDDDLSLQFVIWGTGQDGGETRSGSNTWTMTMRNEISAMANKIEPNGNPAGRWFNTTSPVRVGDVITTNGVLYSLGNVRFGFDNDGDYAPDYNAWVQPISQANYDPTCFRLIRTSGMLTVTRGGGNPTMYVNFKDTLYFTNIPADNTNVRGEVYYTFLALNGPCSMDLSPYQEVASGFDNEKFNGDYGKGLPPVESLAPNVTISKSSNPDTIAKGSTTTYRIPFANTGTKSAGLTISTSGINMPLVVSDTVPNGMQLAAAATYNLNFSPNSGVTIRYSTNSGATWSATAPVGSTSTWPNNKIIIQWWLNDPLPAGSTGNYAEFQATVPSGYSGASFIENTACIGLGEVKPFACATDILMVRGNNSIGDLIWKDEDGDGLQDGGTAEPGINGVTVRLYWDKNNNGFVDAGEPQINAAKVNVIDGKLDLDGNGTANDNGELDAYNIIGGLIDVNGDGSITSADDGTALIGGYNVIDGCLDVNGSGSITSADDGLVTGTMTQSQSATIADGLVTVTSGPTNVFAGYNLIGGRLDVNGDGAITTADDGTALIGGYNTGTQAVVLYNVIDGYVDVSGNGAIGSDDDAGLSGTYGFAYLPNARYIVEVLAADTDVPTGYTPTTVRQYAVNLTGGTNNRTSDFGFGPALRIDKHLDSLNPAYVGEKVTFHIDLYNTMPGDGTASGFCQYVIYPTIIHVDGSLSPPGGAGPLKQWANPSNILGQPDNAFASTDMADASELIGLSGFNRLGVGNITKVETLIYFREVQDFISGSRLFVRVWDDSLGGAIGMYTYNDIYFSGSGGTDYVIRENVTSLRTGGWTWSHFLNNTTEMQIEADKGSGPDGGEAAVDSVAYIITTDRLCASADSTIAVLPLVDTYDADLLQFLYADPPVSSATTSGSAPNTVGTLTWDNLGPLYAGGVRSVAVTFRALATVASPGTTDTASVTDAKFANGRDTNDDDDDAQVIINASGSIAGTVWADGGTTTGWVTPLPSNGYDGSDTFIPNVKVELHGCYSLITGRLLTSGEATTGKNCTDAANKGEWRLVATAYTDGSGNYAFTGLRDGYYNVEINDGNPPTGFPTRRAEPNLVGNGSGFTCGTCDGLWNSWTANLSTFNYLDNTSGGENINRVNFGYINSGVGAVAGYVWHDLDADGVRDAGEQPIAGVSVSLTCTGSGCPGSISPVTTDANGYYQFTGLPVANANYQVVVTPPSGMSQSGDPDVPNAPCGVSCDNTKSSFTLAAGQVRGPYNFGYTGGLTIGDTIYVDWNGDGDQDSGEEGIQGVVVYLYRDVDGDGVRDPDEPLLATTTTNSNGFYQFTNLPGNGAKYLVIVSDTSIPAGYTQTADPDAIKDSRTQVTLTTSSVNTADFGYQPRGVSTIGDYVWRDNDGDGIQDASESGINGVTVNLYQDQDGDGVIDAEDALVATTLTGLSVIDGYIDVDRNGSIGAADDSPALVGVRIIDGRLDINSDGVVNTSDDGTYLGYTVIDGLLDMNNSGTITTADDGTLNGLYQFRNLPAGNYIVEIPGSNFGSGQPLNGLTQTYDQDSATVLDNKDQVALGSAQNYVLGDFGYASSAIGDRVWQDSNRNGNQDLGEPGINGVTVGLYTWTDVDGDGVYDASVDTISSTPLATQVTSGNGNYLFTGLPAGNYVVKVNSGIPAGYTQSGDPDWLTPCTGSGLCDGASGVKLQTGQTDMSRDFGYIPPGVIGDYVWFDADADGVQDAGEGGIGYVTVRLCSDANCNTILATTQTDSDGYYSFGNLSGTSYYVRVDNTTLPSGVSPTYDLDGTGTPHVAAVTLPSGGSNLNADFGYRYSGAYSLSGYVFFDAGSTTDGTNDTYNASQDYAYAGMTLYLWRDGKIVGQTTTDSNGYYAFTNLPPGNYTVSVDRSGALGLMALTATPNNTPQVKSFNTVTITNANITNQDFGFYASMDMGDLPPSYNYNILMREEGPIHINTSGGAVPTIYLGVTWDAEADGAPDTGAGMNGGTTGDDRVGSDDEDGIDFGSTTWSWGATVPIAVTIADTDPTYQPYLVGWFDWNRDGDLNDAGEMIKFGNLANGTHNLQIKIPAGSGSAVINMRFRLYATQSPPPVIAPTGAVINGEVEDYQKPIYPTAVTLVSFTAAPDGQAIRLDWETASELNNIGFNLYRALSPQGPWTRLNGNVIAAANPGSVMGASYTYLDETVKPGLTYYYLLEDIDRETGVTQHGPVSAMVGAAPRPFKLYLPAVFRP